MSQAVLLNGSAPHGLDRLIAEHPPTLVIDVALSTDSDAAIGGGAEN